MRHRGPNRGPAAWSIRHPIGVTMIALAVVVLGLSVALSLPLDLLPHIIYPEVRVRVLDPGVPATVMEDRVTRQLEEQLAITEDAIAVQSRTTEGRSAVDLSFAYGKDIDRALRDASTRLDRARRFLPDRIDPPIIYKRDPSQIPALELVVGSGHMDAVQLRTWVDNRFAKWFLNLPGVAAVEVGGGLEREIRVLPDPLRLAGFGLSPDDLTEALRSGNRDDPAGRLEMPLRRIGSRTAGRLGSLEAITALPLPLETPLARDSDRGRVPPGGGPGRGSEEAFITLGEVASVRDGHGDERLRIRADGLPGIKVSIQKQPNANTVAVVDAVQAQLGFLRQEDLLPPGVAVQRSADQSVYVRASLRNAGLAALSGALLAMLVVYLFLGSLARTLIIGSAIPLAILVTLLLMSLGGLTLNIMTLGGLALGVGLLVDNTIIMLENIVRHQRRGATPEGAAGEIGGAVVAATSTNLASVLPFLFIGGLVGLLFRELIFTISAAIVASLVVALTLVPSLAARIPLRPPGVLRRRIDAFVRTLERGYRRALGHALRVAWVWPMLFLAGLGFSYPAFFSGQETFLPPMDDGRVSLSLTADPGVTLVEMDAVTRRVEALVTARPEVARTATTVGGFVFGRSQYESGNRSSMTIQLVPREQRGMSNQAWVRDMTAHLRTRVPAGLRVRMRTGRIRGIRLGRGDDDLSVRIQGPDLETLARLGADLALAIEDLPGVRNVSHSAEQVDQELAVILDRERAAALGVNVADVGRALRLALEGEVVTDYVDGGRAYDLRVRLPRRLLDGLDDLEALPIFRAEGPPLSLEDVAKVRRVAAPGEILRDRQQRIVEVSASLDGEVGLGVVGAEIERVLDAWRLPPGYSAYTGGEIETLRAGRRTFLALLGLALFLVFVVMAVQYESLRNPLVILLGVPFAAIGVALGLLGTGTTPSMPVWLGMIMLAGIVVNNAIVLVETIEQRRSAGAAPLEAVGQAAAWRLRPILMTTLTTVVGMTPLALGWGEGAEMLQPLARTIVWGLSFSLLVSLLLVPALYRLLAIGRTAAARA